LSKLKVSCSSRRGIQAEKLFSEVGATVKRLSEELKWLAKFSLMELTASDLQLKLDRRDLRGFLELP
jgi:hypothetical protein